MYKRVKISTVVVKKTVLGTESSLATEDSGLNLLCKLAVQSNRLPLPDIHTQRVPNSFQLQSGV